MLIVSLFRNLALSTRTAVIAALPRNLLRPRNLAVFGHDVAMAYLADGDRSGQAGRDVRTYGGRLVKMRTADPDEVGAHEARSTPLAGVVVYAVRDNGAVTTLSLASDTDPREAPSIHPNYLSTDHDIDEEKNG